MTESRKGNEKEELVPLLAQALAPEHAYFLDMIRLLPDVQALSEEITLLRRFFPVVDSPARVGVDYLATDLDQLASRIKSWLTDRCPPASRVLLEAALLASGPSCPEIVDPNPEWPHRPGSPSLRPGPTEVSTIEWRIARMRELRGKMEGGGKGASREERLLLQFAAEDCHKLLQRTSLLALALRDPHSSWDPALQILASSAVERALLAYLLGNGRIPDEIRDLLGREDFAEERHRVIYDAMLRLTEETDCLSFCQSLEREGLADRVGGLGYVMSLIDAPRSPCPAGADLWLRLLKLSHLREVVLS